MLYGILLSAATGLVAEVPARPTAPPPRPLWHLPGCWGRVLAVGPDEIVLQCLIVGMRNPGRVESDWTGTVVTHTGWPVDLWEPWSHRGRRNAVRFTRTRGGFTETDWWGRTRTVRRADEPPRRFWVGTELEDGKYRPWLGADYSYRLADVREGDEVRLRLDSGPHYSNLCVGISIVRRPGGIIPPAPGENPGWDLPHHERMQAYQDWEERGAPVPEKYMSSFYRERAEQRQRERTAPPPREARPRRRNGCGPVDPTPATRSPRPGRSGPSPRSTAGGRSGSGRCAAPRRRRAGTPRGSPGRSRPPSPGSRR